MSDASGPPQIGPTWKIRNEETGDVKTFFEWVGIQAHATGEDEEHARAAIVELIEREAMTVLGPPPGSS